MLEFVEEALDEIALTVEGEIARQRHCPAGMGRNKYALRAVRLRLWNLQHDASISTKYPVTTAWLARPNPARWKGLHKNR